MQIYGKELLSVIVTIYNSESFLPRCLDSIIQQTYKNLEIICVDDGSTDKSGKVADEYAKIDKRIQVIHKENGGVVSARKAGVERANGNYATYVDSDDYIECMMYEEMMRLAVENSADIVTSGIIRDYYTGRIINSDYLEPGVYIGKDLKEKVLTGLIDTNSFYRAGIINSVCNKIFEISKLKKAQMNVDNQIQVGDDAAVIYPILFRSNSIVISGNCYYHYCIREKGSVVGTKFSDDLKRLQLVFDYLEKEFNKADGIGLNLKKQFYIWKTYIMLLRNSMGVMKYKGGTLYPFGKISKQDKIVLYGAGKFGVEMKRYLDKQGFHVVAWVDKSSSRLDVFRPECLDDISYDIVIISVLNVDVVQDIKTQFRKLGKTEEQLLCVDVNLIKELL